MEKRFRSIRKAVFAVIVFACIVIVCFPTILMFLATCLSGAGAVYLTESLDNYGNYKGNYDNEAPTKFISSFFPERIEDSFTDVVYHYKAIKGDTYAFEAYLEFKISEEMDFLSYIEAISDRECVAFDWGDGSFVEYTISDVYDIDVRESMGSIDYARIGKILYSPEKQTVIFWALGVNDGGYARTAQLNYLFSKFGIDPVEYAKKTGDDVNS